MSSATRSLRDRLHDRLLAAVDRERLATVLFDGLAHHVPYDFACFAVTDPTSGLITWAAKSRPLGVGDEDFAASEYGPPDLNQFAELARRRPPVGVLSIDTDGHPEAARRMAQYMGPQFGFTDELRAALTSRSATWGALALYRGPGDPPFSAGEADQVAAVCEPAAAAVQRCLFAGSGASRSAGEPAGPAVMVVDASGRAVQTTTAVPAVVEELGGYDHGSLPENVLAVVARSRHGDQHVHSRVRGRSGTWLSIGASPLSGAGRGPADVVVTIEPTPQAQLSRLALAAHGLTAREEDVVSLVLQGVSTQGIARSLHLSPHTVQDHLKTVFAKVGVSSRRELTARLLVG
ncbi:response regulator transcription factor [Nocardioides mangrovicus]|uniref:response regulator transcription factor n=1 Tax=Nocardioides mangrovicus TaxID=2478913 RepID=UPI0018E07E2B|nr:helix-turn-helix transcriptional regulator [Nocardioides mangrovicus]